jgi:hypothetical protein
MSIRQEALLAAVLDELRALNAKTPPLPAACRVCKENEEEAPCLPCGHFKKQEGMALEEASDEAR